MLTLREGNWGFDSGTLRYPRVSSCLTLSVINGGIIYGMHGIIIPSGNQWSISQLILKMKNFKTIQQDAKLIIACDFGTWGRDGRQLPINGQTTRVTDFTTLADYLGIARGGATISGKGQFGNVTLVDVAEGSDFFKTKSQSAYFLVNINGTVQGTEAIS